MSLPTIWLETSLLTCINIDASPLMLGYGRLFLLQSTGTLKTPLIYAEVCSAHTSWTLKHICFTFLGNCVYLRFSFTPCVCLFTYLGAPCFALL